MLKVQSIALYTIVRKEVIRFVRIWMQSLLPPVITISLYYVIFGSLIGKQIANIHDYPYMQFIAPGLIMMFVINSAYGNVVASLYSTRFMHSIDEIIVSPCSNTILLLGYILGGLARGCAVGLITTVVTLFFTQLHIQHPLETLLIFCMSAILFSLAGFANALFARSFDDINIIPTFVLIPLTYFGGVFYSIDMLSEFWQDLSRLNPILYMVNGFRHGILGISDTGLTNSYLILSGAILCLLILNLLLLRKGVGLRT